MSPGLTNAELEEMETLFERGGSMLNYPVRLSGIKLRAAYKELREENGRLKAEGLFPISKSLEVEWKRMAAENEALRERVKELGG